MASFMENKILIILLIFFISCNRNSKSSDLEYEEYLENTIRLSSFDNYRVNKISFQEVNKLVNKVDYNSPTFDSIHNYKSTDLYFQLDTISTKFINKGCYIIINDSIKYKITDIKSGEIERFGNWGTVGFEYVLKEYKLNDSIIKNLNIITIFKK